MSEQQTKPAPDAEPKKKRSKLLWIGFPVLVLLLAGGGGGWWYLGQAKAAAAASGEAPAAEPEPVEPTGVVAFDPFVVNLSDPGGRKFLRAAVVLLVASAKEVTELEENEMLLLKVRSSILETMTLRTSSELTTAEGRTALKKAIAETATAISHVEVKDVLFQEFIVQ